MTEQIYHRLSTGALHQDEPRLQQETETSYTYFFPPCRFGKFEFAHFTSSV